MPPGYGLDLQQLVEEAIAKGQPNALVGEMEYEDASLFAVVIARLYDLADKLLEAKATVTDDEKRRIFRWYPTPDVVAFFVKHHIPLEAEHLLCALPHDQWDTIYALLDTGIDIQMPVPIPNRSGNKTTTLLHIVAWAGRTGALQNFLKRGAIVDAFDDEGVTPVMKACESKHYGRAKCAYLLLKHGANPNVQTPERETPLLLCVVKPITDTQDQRNRNDIVQILLNNGADPNALSPVGTTALMLAARDNDELLVRSLLNAGADRALQTPDGQTALDVAVKCKSKKVASMLR